MFESKEHINPFDWLKNKVVNDGKKLVLFGVPGNLGDMLIVASIIQNLEKRSIDFEVGSELYHECIEGNEIYVIMGSGNYIPLYNGVKSILDSLDKKVPEAEVVVLPSSSYGMERHIKSLSLNLTFFCRELETYQSISSVLPEGHVFLSHDAALYIDLKDRRFLAMRNLRKVFNSREGGTLYALREDREKTDSFVIEEQYNNIDISLLRTNRGARFLSKYSIDTNAIFEDVNFMLMYLVPFDKIVSDRLHVCIAALILGKEIEMYDNSYGKLSRVYRNSLISQYKNKVIIKF